MDNRTAHSTDTSNGKKAKGIYRWLREVKEEEPPEVQPPFNHFGEPLYRGQKNSNRPQIFTCLELENERRRNGELSPDVTESPILTREPVRYGSAKRPRKPSSIPSSHTEPGREVCVDIDCTGKKILSTNERVIQLEEGEEIDPSGRTTESACPTITGRHRTLSRSNALKNTSSPFAESHIDLEKLKNVTSHPSETLKPKQVKFDEPDKGSHGYLTAPGMCTNPSTSATYPGKPTFNAGATRITRSATRAAKSHPKPRASKFDELL